MNTSEATGSEAMKSVTKTWNIGVALIIIVPFVWSL